MILSVVIGTIIGLYSLIALAIIWAKIDNWWWLDGKLMCKKIVLRYRKPWIQPRTQGIWAMRWNPTYYCVSEFAGTKREGIGKTAALAWLDWYFRPTIILSGGIERWSYRAKLPAEPPAR